MSLDDLDVSGHHAVVEFTSCPTFSDFGRISALTFPSTKGALNIPASKALARVCRTVFLLSTIHDFPTYLCCHDSPPAKIYGWMGIAQTMPSFLVLGRLLTRLCKAVSDREKDEVMRRPERRPGTCYVRSCHKSITIKHIGNVSYRSRGMIARLRRGASESHTCRP